MRTATLSLARPLFVAALAVAACGPEAPVEGEKRTGSVREAVTDCGGPNYLEGIDVSHWETVDFAKVASSNAKFAIMKATESTGYVDPTFAGYYAAAKANGLVRGAYHFHRVAADPKAQIDNFLSTVTFETGDLPPILDVEDTNATSASATTASVLACLQYLEQKTGRVPMIYTGMWYWSGTMNDPKGFSKYPMWMSAYPNTWAEAQNHTYCPSIPSDFPGWVMWQYSDGAQADAPVIPGVGKGCDRSFFNGTLAELIAFAGGSSPVGAGGSGAGGSGAGGTGTGAGGTGVMGTYAAKYVKQSWPLSNAPAIQMKVGQTLTGSIDMMNTGTATWPAGVVKLAPIPRDKASGFHSSSWLSATRVSSPSADVAPGQVGHFEWDLTASQAGDFSPYFGLVADGIVWFADSGGPPDNDIQVHVVVSGASAGAGGSGAAGAGAGAGTGAGAGAGTGAGAGAGAGTGAGAGAGTGAGTGAGAGAGTGAGTGAGAVTGAGAGAGTGAGAGGNGASGGGKTSAGGATAIVDEAPASSSSGGCGVATGGADGRGAVIGLGLALSVIARRRRARGAALGRERRSMTDDELFLAFAERTLPAAEWNHRAHLRVAFLHAARWPVDEAHVLLRVGIVRLNAAHGLVETKERGYHETITRFWLERVAELRAMDAAAGREHATSEAFCEAHPEILDRDFPLRFYSRERLFSVRARAIWIEGDVTSR